MRPVSPLGQALCVIARALVDSESDESRHRYLGRCLPFSLLDENHKPNVIHLGPGFGILEHAMEGADIVNSLGDKRKISADACGQTECPSADTGSSIVIHSHQVKARDLKTSIFGSRAKERHM